MYLEAYKSLLKIPDFRGGTNQSINLYYTSPGAKNMSARTTAYGTKPVHIPVFMTNSGNVFISLFSPSTTLHNYLQYVVYTYQPNLSAVFIDELQDCGLMLLLELLSK